MGSAFSARCAVRRGRDRSISATPPHFRQMPPKTAAFSVLRDAATAATALKTVGALFTGTSAKGIESHDTTDARRGRVNLISQHVRFLFTLNALSPRLRRSETYETYESHSGALRSAEHPRTCTPDQGPRFPSIHLRQGAPSTIFHGTSSRSRLAVLHRCTGAGCSPRRFANPAR